MRVFGATALFWRHAAPVWGQGAKFFEYRHKKFFNPY
jgi:hypothetical protein